MKSPKVPKPFVAKKMPLVKQAKAKVHVIGTQMMDSQNVISVVDSADR
jgi:hypothetical protein